MIWWIFELIWYLYIYIMIYLNDIVPDALNEFPGPISVVFPVSNIAPELYNETLFSYFPMGQPAFNQSYWMNFNESQWMGVNGTMSNSSMMTHYEGHMMGNMSIPKDQDWDLVTARFGNRLTPFQTLFAPGVYWEAESRRDFYTLIEVDLDVSTGGQFLHWMVVNIPGSDLPAGETKVSYASSAPPEGTGEHRYVWIVYRQMMGRQDFSEFPTSPMNPLACLGNRFGFDLEKFVESYGLVAHGTNFVRVEYGPLSDVFNSLFETFGLQLPQDEPVCAKPLPLPQPEMKTTTTLILPNKLLFRTRG